MKKISLSLLVAFHCTAYAASINGLSHHATPSGQYEIVFEGVGVMPRTFTTTGPDTVVLDFAQTESHIAKRDISVATSGIYGVNLVEGSGRTRAVVNLAAPLNYHVTSRGKDIVLVLNASGGVRPVAPVTRGSNTLFNSVAVSGKPVVGSDLVIAAPSSVTPVSSAKPQFTTASQISASNPVVQLNPVYTPKKGGKGELSFVLPASVSNVSVRQDGNKIVALLDGFYAPKIDQKRMEVAGYKTPVENIDIFRRARGTEIVLNLKRSTAFEYASYQNGDVYTVEVKPAPVDTSLQKQIDELQGFSPSKRYRGAPLSLNFQDIEVRAVLQIIAEFTNNNIVVSDAVAGNITLRLDNVPWDQALDIILKTKGLGMRENGSVIYIAPASELDQREIDALKVIQERDQLVPAQTELIQIKYANAADLAAILERSRESGGGDGRAAYVQDSILSGKGTVSVDQRTNTLLVSDIPSKLQAVRDLVARLDEPVRQVLVDARLVLTSDNFSRELGAKLGLTFLNTGRNGLVTGSGTAEAASNLNVEMVNNANSGGNTTIELPNLSDRLGVNLPAGASGVANYGLAILGSDFLVDLELSALQQEGRAEIVSSPRVVTQDGKKANIASGAEIPYNTVSREGFAVTEFKNAKLSLDVTPRIAPDSRVDMLLDITNDRPDPSLVSPRGDIGLQTNQLETNVLVDNGETIVLGGIYQQNQSTNVSKVPLLGDLPIVGNAFKKTSKNFEKSELLIFVTPRIIDNRLSDYDKFSNLRN